MSRPLRAQAVALLVFAAALTTSVCAAETSLTLSAASIDSMYPNTCVASAGCFPSKLPDGTLGFTGTETIVAWRGVNFPSNPVRIEIQCASPQASTVDFYFNGGPNDQLGMYWWYCDVPASGSYGTQGTSSCPIDYGILGAIDLSGTHDVYLGFRCPSAGCGNYKSFTFYFDASAVTREPATRVPAASTKQKNIVAIGAMRLLPPAGIANPHSVQFYDLRGRPIKNIASPQTGRRAAGVMIARSAQ